MEAIAGYRPDLVVASFDPRGMAAALRRLGITVVIHGGASTFKGAYQQIRQLGMITGREPAARKLIANMKKGIARVLATSKAKARGLSVYHELTPDFYSASSNSFVGKVYAAFGLRNIADEADSAGTGYPQLSAEYIVASSPDLIVLADTRVLRAEALDGRGATRGGTASRRCRPAPSSASTTRSRRAGARVSCSSSGRCRSRWPASRTRLWTPPPRPL